MTEFIQTKERTYIDFEKEFLNNIIHIGKLNFTGARSPLLPHQHKDALEICYVYRGNPVFLVNDREYHLKGGDIFLSFPNEIHSTGKHPLDKMVLYWLGIRTENRVGNFLQFHDSKEANAFLDALRGLKERTFRGSKKLKDLIDEALILYFSNHDFREILIRNRITDFLVSVIDFEKKSSRTEISPLINDSITFIMQNIHEKIHLTQLADKTGLSLPRFKQRFKDETGVPPGEYVLRQKIKEAEQQLSGSDKEITAIAYDLEFSSSQYFATVFRRYTGSSPTDFRKAIQS